MRNLSFTSNVGQLFLIFLLIALFVSPPVANIFFALTIILLISNKIYWDKCRLFFLSTQGKFSLLFILLILSGVFYSKASFTDSIAGAWGWRKILLLPLGYVFFSYSPNAKIKAAKMFIFSSCFLATLSFLLYILTNHNGIIVRNHSTQGLFFAVGIISICILIILNKYSNSTEKLLLITSALILLGNIAMITESRSAFIALIAMFITLFMNIRFSFDHFKKHFFLVLCACIAITTFIYTPSSRNSINVALHEFEQSKTNIGNSSVGLRVQFLKNTLELVPKYLYIGAGTSGFDFAYREHIAEKPIKYAMTGDPHNQYLKILVEYGVFGLLIFLCLLASFFTVNLSPASKLLLICPLVGWCVTSLANSHFSTFNEGLFIWLWLGIFSSFENY